MESRKRSTTGTPAAGIAGLRFLGALIGGLAPLMSPHPAGHAKSGRSGFDGHGTDKQPAHGFRAKRKRKQAIARASKRRNRK